MSKHTPGPWKFVIHNRVEIVGPKDSSGWPMQVVYNCGMPDDATAIANARLIANSPLLYETLQTIVDEAHVDCLGRLTIDCEDRMKLLAILKIIRGEA
jgi:hypothetical protein